jgi:hypothetical protein
MIRLSRLLKRLLLPAKLALFLGLIGAVPLFADDKSGAPKVIASVTSLA